MQDARKAQPQWGVRLQQVEVVLRLQQLRRHDQFFRDTDLQRVATARQCFEELYQHLVRSRSDTSECQHHVQLHEPTSFASVPRGVAGSPRLSR